MNESRVEFMDIIANLPPGHAELLRMKYELDMSYQEMANQLGITVQNLKGRLNNARVALKRN
ncbi:MAG: sigma factor-like helix-turn-helix DNA-binding protein, partial [Patescibacteria group bacterium]